MIKKFFYNLPFLVCCLLLAWFVLSYVDMVAGNLTTHNTISTLNFFYIVGGVGR